METRRRTNKRQIDFSSSEDDDTAKPIQYKVKRVILKQPTAAPAASAREAPKIQPQASESFDLVDGHDTSELSEADSLDEEEADMDEELLGADEPDLQGETDYDDSEEDEEAIIRDMMKPMIDKSKKTKRQKARDAALESGASTELWSLPTSRQTAKPALTAEEAALRKSENARKRKNQNEKKLEEEKQETINRLLNKQATKARGAVSKTTFNEAMDEEDEQAPVARATRPLPRGMIRYVSNKDGASVSLSVEILGHPMTATVFGPAPVSIVGETS